MFPFRSSSAAFGSVSDSGMLPELGALTSPLSGACISIPTNGGGPSVLVSSAHNGLVNNLVLSARYSALMFIGLSTYA